MAVLRCKMCGASLNVTEGASITECEFCGSRQTIPRIRLQNQGEKKATLFGRAGRLLGACEFDKAYTVYEGITEEFPEEAEAYWGLLLCRYGIEYVDDPETGRKIPTCHRSSFTSLNEDEDFRMVLKYAAPEALPLYQEEGRQIEELRRQILQASAREQPYDIFLCYKESDEGGNRTQDSVTAQEIYDHLTQHGYRVFFSRISLEEKLGAEYEPVIFAALQSAKIMLAVGSSYEHFNAVWVKNEWSRFLKLIQSGQKKVLIPCYFDMDPEDLPAELSHLQAQDMKKLGALQDLTRGIDKLLGRKAQNTSQAPGSDSTVQAYLKRVDLFLEDGEWDHAEEYCEKILDLDPDNSSAYLRRWLAEHRSASLSELVRAGGIFEDDGDYQKAVRFAEAGRKKQLKEAAEAAKEALYQKYVRLIRQTKAPDISQLEEAKKQLPRLRDYKDAKKLLSECNEIHNTILLGITDQIMKEAADAMKAGKY